MKPFRANESLSTDLTNALLDALAGSIQSEPQEPSLRPDLPPMTRQVVVQAHDLRADVERVVKAAGRLPASRSDFLIYSLQRWRRHLGTTKRAQRDAWQEVEAAARSTAPGTEERHRVMHPALRDYMRSSGALAFSKATFRGLVVADSITAGTRIAILALIALAALGLDQAFDANAPTSLGLATVSFVVLDRVLVDRLLEPALEVYGFRRLLAACNATIEACQGIENNPHHIASALDGVILPVSVPDEAADGED